MRLNEKRLIPYLIVIIPLVLVLTASFFITTFYLNKVTSYFASVKERSFNERIDMKKAESELFAKQIKLLFEYKYNHLEENIKKELDARIEIASKSASFIYNKYKKRKKSSDIKERIVDALSHMKYGENENFLFITNYRGNSILKGAQPLDEKGFVKYQDKDHRTIVLEQIQLVKKYGEAFIVTDDVRYAKELIKLKDLGFYEWFVGTSIRFEVKKEKLKNELLHMLSSIPVDNDNFLLLYESEENVYKSSEMLKNLTDKDFESIKHSLTEEKEWHKNVVNGYYYHTLYFKPLALHLVYGFDITSMSKKDIQKQKALEHLLDEELAFVIKASLAIILIVAILSLLLSLKINTIFRQYQEEVAHKREELEELNSSLEERVKKEIKSHQEKEKMLIQQSKMAEMGDMLSMIAHQWRQPLNQLSYTLMNIDSAYEFKELTQEYLDDKIAEANKQLEFMSTTIDDFKNYFKPDKEKEVLNVSEVVVTSVALMQHAFKNNAIEVELLHEGEYLHSIYRNEFIQVLLNLIKNAKDVLVAKKIQNPKLSIKTVSKQDSLTLLVCDNGGGIDPRIIEKIFDPYFSTKDDAQGTGLGLYMSKMIIQEHHNGTLSTYNTKNGACFKIDL